ncbi:MAG TPA: TetR/AcrR family transcriptional regulator C-terminal domain-containing protein, partial [Armatimonadota bacterium]
DSEIMSVVPVIFAASEGQDDAQVIRRFIADRFDVWERRRDLMRVVIGEAMFNPALAEGLRGKIQLALQGVEGFIVRRMQDGAFRPVHPGIAARALIGQLLSVFLHWSLLMPHGNLPPREQLIDELTALFMHGVLRQSIDEEEKVR